MTLHMIPAFGFAISEDVLFLIVFAVFGVIKYLTSLHKKDEEADKPAISDEEQARRTREIQEEIRRRIAENKKPQSQAKPVAAPILQRMPESRKAAPLREKPDVIIGRQIDYMEKLAEAREAEAESQRRAREVLALAHIKVTENVAENIKRDGVLTMLDHNSSLRDAFIISEVLAQPVSERRNASCPGMMQ
jgi:hypothetical protein